jgi:diguanylate cyclase (GGDEF)-like protein/putative nucleotidyltransferase with HDIG domain
MEEFSSRVQTLLIGALVTAVVAVAGIAYAVATWSDPNRTAIIALFALAALIGHLPLLAGPARIVGSPLCNRFLLAWGAGAIAITATLVTVDGGMKSPLRLLFFVIIVFVGLSYPSRSVVAIGFLDVATFMVVGLATGSSQATLAFLTACLATVALLCAWKAVDHERQREVLNAASRTDPLTGCLNRRGFEERVEAELDGCRRSGRSAALVVLDLDDFKLVNDTRGHEAGDELLLWTALRATEQLRPMDSLGRLGGDEFAVLVPGAGPLEAREVANRLRDALGERVSVCAGVASFPIDADDRESLHRHADHDLYAEKHGRVPEGGPTTRELAWAAALARAVERRAAVPDEHSSSVAAYAAAIAQRMGWSGGDLSLLRMAAMLHDVGKVSVPDRVLQKPGPLTDAEFDLVKSHSEAGADIVEQVDGLSPVVDWIRHSHEHVDGSGYPAGLAGDDIPAASRILLVAEAYDAMTTRRPYGSPLAPESALEELRINAGAQFDSQCVEALEEHLGLVAA